jgi:serine/threonine protein kinase
MAAPYDCPTFDSWPALLDEALSLEQREPFERHLESCPVCQERIDQLLSSQDRVRRLGWQFGDPTLEAADPVLDQVRERLSAVISPMVAASGEPADMYFLCPSDRPDLLGVLGAYEVQEVIGQGGMGIVLKAFDPALHRFVAIKVMAAAVAGSATARRRFTREAQAAAAVCHDHIVTVHGVYEADGLPYLVMQYVPGESLQARLDRAGPLDVIEVVRIGMQTAAGLAAAHAQGLIHRDIKPANLLLEDGLARVKISDFGLARMVDDVKLTQAGVVAGTPEYMAPEQARAEVVDHRADLFSLGSVMYAMCTGRPPFRATATLALLRQVSEQEPIRPRDLNADVPDWLEAVILRLLAKEPAARIQSAAELAALLEGYLAHIRQPTTIGAPAIPPAPPISDRKFTGTLRGRAERVWPKSAGVAALALAALLGMAFLIRGLFGQGAAPAPVAPARQHLVYDFRTRLDDLPGVKAFGPDAETLLQTDAQGLWITLPAGRPDCNNVGIDVPMTIRGDFEVDVGFELLAIGNDIPNPAAGVQMRLAFADSDMPLAAIARFRNRYPARPRVPLFQTVGHDGETFAAYRITVLPDFKEHPKGIDVRASDARGRLKLARTGPQLKYLVSDGGSPYHLVKSEEVGDTDVRLVRLFGFSGWGPVGVDVRFTDLVIDADIVPEAGLDEVIPQWLTGSGIWLSAALLVGLAICLPLGVWLGWYVRRRAAADQAQPGATPPPGSFPCPACGANLRTRAGLAGKTVKCPRCARAVLVPAGTQ